MITKMQYGGIYNLVPGMVGFFSTTLLQYVLVDTKDELGVTSGLSSRLFLTVDIQNRGTVFKIMIMKV